MSIPLSKEKQAEVTQSIVRFFHEKLDVELSEVQATSLLTYFFHEIGPFAYNQGVEDAQKQLIRLAEDLPGTCFQEPLTYGNRARNCGFAGSRRPDDRNAVPNVREFCRRC